MTYGIHCVHCRASEDGQIFLQLFIFTWSIQQGMKVENFHCIPLQVWQTQVTYWLCLPAAGQENDWDTPAQTYRHTFSKPYIFISGYLICYAGRDWAQCPHSCISITDHITVPQTCPLLIFTQSIQNNGPFLGSFFFHWPLIGCNYSSTKQMSVLRLPWRLDQGTQQCESFAGLHLYW